MSPVPGWLELLVRLCCGEPEEPAVVGVIELVDEYDDEADARPRTVRVLKDRHRHRVETLDGDVLEIRGDDHVLRFDSPGAVPVRTAVGRSEGGFAYDLLRRRDPWAWQPSSDGGDDDFTRPAGPPRPTTSFGREALVVDLLPPSHKSGLLRLTVDAVSGQTYAVENTAYGPIARWIEMETVPEHPVETFEWAGEFEEFFSFSSDTPLEELPEDLRRHVVQEREQEERLEVALDPGPVRLTAVGEVRAFAGEDGDVSAMWDPMVHVRFGRERRPDAPDEHDEDDAATIEWHEGPFRYFVQAHGIDPADAEVFADVLRRWTQSDR